VRSAACAFFSCYQTIFYFPERFSNAGNSEHGGHPFPNLKSWGDGRRIGSFPQFIQWRVAPVGPWIIGISGPSGCGQSTLARQLQISLNPPGEVIVHSFKRSFDRETLESIKIAEFMFVNFHRVMPLRR
jgi:hypothetical protein